MNTRSRLRLATVGAGYFSQFHYDGWARIDAVDLVGVCDRDRDKARAAAAPFAGASCFTGFEAMLDETVPDLVDIIAPPVAHAALLGACIDRGIDAICQKPFCASLDEAREIAALADAKGVMLAVHENFRFQPWFRFIRRYIDDGKLGDAYQAWFRMRPGDGRGPDAYLGRQPYFQSMERFLIHETAIHFIDTFRFLFGPVRAVYADLRRLNPVIAGEDAGTVVFTHDSGVRSVFDGNRLSDHAAKDRRKTMGEFTVEGVAGSLFLNGDGALSWRAFGDNTSAPLACEWEDRGFAGDSVCRLQAHVVAHLLDGAALENGAGDYLANLAIEDAIYRSAAQGCRIEMK